MQNFIKIFLASFIFLTTALLAEDTGSLSVSIFKSGKPLKDVEVILDTKDRYYTDSDGSLHIFLSVGKHRLEIFGKEDGANLGYFRRSIEIKKDKDTQVTAEFSEDDSDEIDVDTPFDTDIAINKATGTALLSGILLSADTGKAIANARIFVMGTDVDARTDASGKFSFEVPSGIKLNVSFIHSEHTSQTLKDVVLTADQTLTKTIKLTPASMELEEFIVLAPKIEGSIASIMAEERKSAAITNIIGSEQISKQGDSSAAGAIKRVTGVTIVDGTDVYVRGLGGRYSSVEMNSMPLPSPDPQRRSVPLDIFPSAVIGSMKVQKSATSDIPASFGGGYVDIRTKGKSKENYIKVSASFKANSYTGSQRYTHDGSSTDYMGSDDGYRKIPSEILNDSAIVIGEPVPQLDQSNQELYQKKITNRNFNTYQETLAPAYKIAFEGAYNIDINDDHSLSLFTNYTYSQDFSMREEEYYNYDYRQSTNSLYDNAYTNGGYGTTDSSSDIYRNSFILNMEYAFQEAFKLKYTKLFSKVSEKTTNITTGILGSDPTEWNTRHDLNWEERTMDIDQINANMQYQVYNTKNKFDVGVEYATALLDQPSRVKYSYITGLRPNGSLQGDTVFDRFDPPNFLNMKVDDLQTAFYFKNKTSFHLLNDGEYLEFGLSSTSKERESRYNKYTLDTRTEKGTDDIDTIFNNHIQNYDDSFTVNISFMPSYWYDAELTESDSYLKLMLKPLDSLEITLGIRSVDYSQTIYSYSYGLSYFNPIFKDPQEFEFKKQLPSASIKYTINSSNILNFAYSQTYIVPDLREYTEGSYFHPYDIAEVKGNPNLKNTDIDNYDLKYNHYFSQNENIGLGFFYKSLKDPIEDTVEQSSSLPIYSYHNADKATLYGIELDGRKSLHFIDGLLKNFYLFGNLSYTESEVVLTKDQEQDYTTNYRQLQGLSPIVINLALGYETDNRSISISYNKMGERIRKVGLVDGLNKNPDTYEVPPHILDFVWIEKFDFGMGLKAKIGNILDSETIWYQQDQEHVTKRFKKGMTFSVSASYKY